MWIKKYLIMKIILVCRPNSLPKMQPKNLLKKTYTNYTRNPALSRSSNPFHVSCAAVSHVHILLPALSSPSRKISKAVADFP